MRLLALKTCSAFFFFKTPVKIRDEKRSSSIRTAYIRRAFNVASSSKYEKEESGTLRVQTSKKQSLSFVSMCNVVELIHSVGIFFFSLSLVLSRFDLLLSTLLDFFFPEHTSPTARTQDTSAFKQTTIETSSSHLTGSVVTPHFILLSRHSFLVFTAIFSSCYARKAAR